MADSVSKGRALTGLQERLGYHFKDEDLLIQALTHSSRGPQNNERLEFLGDAVLKFVLSHYLFGALSQAGEGELTKERASLETNARLAQIACDLDVASLVRLGKGAQKDGISTNEGLLAGVVEAIIAAIYLDGSLDDVVNLIHRHLDLNWNSSDSRGSRMPHVGRALLHPKTELQELTIKKFGVYPIYSNHKSQSTENELIWGARCEIPNSKLETEGEAANIQAAETIAAQKMLALIQK
ncbi:MAG: putative dsRNA-binding protein [Gammaproteobacteria bacterium]|nr:putative dsRNA-binding protein [Gammaproteobacteria bacterium]